MSFVEITNISKNSAFDFFTSERILHLSDSWDHSINQKSPRTPEIYDFDFLKFFCLSLFDMFLVTMWSNENIEIEVFSHCRQLFSHFQDGSEKWIILETPICDVLQSLNTIQASDWVFRKGFFYENNKTDIWVTSLWCQSIFLNLKTRNFKSLYKFSQNSWINSFDKLSITCIKLKKIFGGSIVSTCRSSSTLRKSRIEAGELLLISLLIINFLKVCDIWLKTTNWCFN